MDNSILNSLFIGVLNKSVCSLVQLVTLLITSTVVDGYVMMEHIFNGCDELRAINFVTVSSTPMSDFKLQVSATLKVKK